ncbi:MAG: NUDIX domain-containing protein [bacterium]|nr:NUDIX domain-containing protein [bacterium]
MRKPRKIFLATSLVILENDKLLLSLRKNTGWYDGQYSLVSGHFELGELVLDASMREAKEEIGIDVKPDDLSVAHIMHRRGDDGERVDFFVRVQRWKGHPKNNEPDRCEEISWFPLNALPENLVPPAQVGLDAIRRGLFFSEHGWE